VAPEFLVFGFVLAGLGGAMVALLVAHTSLSEGLAAIGFGLGPRALGGGEASHAWASERETRVQLAIRVMSDVTVLMACGQAGTLDRQRTCAGARAVRLGADRRRLGTMDGVMMVGRSDPLPTTDPS
jgi:hypothetical protein